MNEDTLKAYLSSKYQGAQSFLDNVIFPIFGEDDFEDEYEAEQLQTREDSRLITENTGIQSIKALGKIYVGAEPLQIFDVTVSDRVIMERNRVGVQQLIRRIMDQFSCAFMIFHYKSDVRWDWRFSFCHKKTGNADASDSKRFTYLLGPGQSCRTAAENFMTIYEKRGHIEVDDIEKAFSVEVLSKEFFGKYKGQYDKFVEYLSNPANGMRDSFIDTDFETKGLTPEKIRDLQEKPIRDYVKKLLGRIVFLHFLQKKGWLGVPADRDWGDGDRDFMLHLFEYATQKQKDDFLDEILEPLFNDAFDTNRSNSHDLFDTKVEGFRNVRIPYLNGGLFERDDLDKNDSWFPPMLFEELLDTFSQYNFTIDENDPNDAEVGVDPEMLGRIFENLLEDNKDKGAFYTPKEIVKYMCQESLIAYLQTDYVKDEVKDKIRKFVYSHNADDLGSMKGAIDVKLKEVKICDPAIGSGAFPMGLLRELFYCRCAIEPSAIDNAAKIKREIIQNNIYGVDIEKGAVDIARLRFWLSLIVEEKSPDTLPNLDFKIMQGNSLLEQYQGFDLSKLTQAPRKETYFDEQGERTFFEDKIDALREDLIDKIKEHYKCDNHENRRKLRKEIAKIVKEQIEADGRSISIDEDKIIENTEFFLWHTWFNDVFSRPSKGGFDIVIGNPPYIQLQDNDGVLGRLYEKCGYETFTRTGDIYCLFYERGQQLLRKGGHLCFITSNKWMRAGYGEKLRGFFAGETNPKLLIDFAGIKIFESATVDTNILLFAKEKNEHKTLCAVGDKQTKRSINNLSVFVEQNATVCEFGNSDSWVILSPIEQSIKKKIESVGTPLKDWDIEIYRGVLTGCNEAFIISTERRKEILANCRSEAERSRTEELIRPILRGRDIKRYGYEWANLWLIYLPWHFPYQFDDSITGASDKAETAFKEQYPAVYAHMLQYKRQLSARNKAEVGIRYEWYALQRWGAKYWEDFSKPKIIYPETTQGAYFAYDKNSMFIDKTCFMLISPDAEYIQATLSSKLFEYAYKQIYSSVELGEHGYQYNKHALVKLPVCKIHCRQDTYSDKYFYDLYNLSGDEIDFIKKQ